MPVEQTSAQVTMRTTEGVSRRWGMTNVPKTRLSRHFVSYGQSPTLPGKPVLALMTLFVLVAAKADRTKMVLSEMSFLLLELWCEQHPEGHEQTRLNSKRADQPLRRCPS